ncbi:MAG: hypothetical protein M5U09_13750 [Gammaproteobacteria bacterium]|nr:hypothetical protein [Gammaproteobacteria bacterium]
MKAFVRQSQGRLLRVTVPPFPLTAIAGQLYSPANVVQWDPAYEPDVFVAELDAEAAADATTLDVVEWPAGARPPRAGDPVFLAAAVEPGSHPIEPFTVDYVDGTTVAIRGGRLRFTWAAGSKLYLRYVDVPLVAVDLAEPGAAGGWSSASPSRTGRRTWRVRSSTS